MSIKTIQTQIQKLFATFIILVSIFGTLSALTLITSKVVDKVGVSAAANCPSGYNWNGSQCEQRVNLDSNTSYYCPSFGSLSGASCNINVAGFPRRGIISFGPYLEDYSPCPSNYYNPMISIFSSICVPNDIGGFSTRVGRDCPSGSYSVIVTLCVPNNFGGFYSSLDGTCADNYFFAIATVSTPLCIPNDVVISATANTTTSCPSGYQNLGGSPPCVAFAQALSFTCPAGQYLTNQGTDSCTPCPAGSYCPGNVGAPQIPCPFGNFCPAGSGSPTACPIDTYSSLTVTTGASFCTNWICPATITTYCTNGNTNSPQAGVVYMQSDFKEPSITNNSPGSTVTVRVPYDNRTNRELKDVNIKTSLPTGFTYVNDSFRTCKNPTKVEEVCDTKTSVERNAMFAKLTNTTATGGLSPAATFYDGVDTGANGTAVTSTTGILDAGKKRFLNLNGCTYLGSGLTRFSLLTDVAPFGSPDTDSSNTAITKNGCRGGTLADPYENGYTQNLKAYGLYYKYFDLAQCAGVTSDTGTSTFWTDSDPNLKAFSGGSNGNPVFDGNGNACTLPGTVFTFDGNDSGYNRVELLRNRYINISQCMYNDPVYHRKTNLLNNTVNSLNAFNFKAQFEASNTPITNNTCGIGGNGWTGNIFSHKSIDTLDTTRARGFFEFQMVVPTTAVQPSYTQSVAMTGKDNTGSAITPLIQNGTINTGASGATTLSLNAYLSGAFDPASINATNPDGIMTNTLSTKNLLPTLQPYNTPPYNYQGSETLPDPASRSNQIVDWVLVEVRDTTTASGGLGNLITTKAAVMMADGTIKDASSATMGNTNSSIDLTGIPVSGNYKIILRHRNHIAIATKNPIPLTLGGNTTFSFASNTNVKGDNQEPIGVVGGGTYSSTAAPGTTGSYIYGLRKADTDGNGQVDASDRNILITSPEYDGIYDNKDLNLDGVIDATDRNMSQNTGEASGNL